MTLTQSGPRRSAWTDDDNRALVERLHRRVADQLADERAGRHVDPTTELQLASEFALAELEPVAAQYLRETGNEFPEALERELVAAIKARLFGLGWFESLLEDDSIENIRAVGSRCTIVDYADGRSEFLPPVASSDQELLEWAADFAGSSGRRLDNAMPQLRLRLKDGSRLFAVTAVTEEPNVFIRRHRLLAPTLDELAQAPYDTMPPDLAEFLEEAVPAGLNIMVAGGMNTGKTTMLRALAAAIPDSERIVVIESDRELCLDAVRHPDLVSFEAKPPNVEGEGEVTCADLVEWAMRTSTGRLILGEMLGGEGLPFLHALTSGAFGLCSIHARSPEAVFRRLVTLLLIAGVRMTPAEIAWVVAEAIDVVVHMAKLGPRRVVTAVSEVGTTDGERISTNALWVPDQDGRARRSGAPFGSRVLSKLGGARGLWAQERR